jgi:hypothetical protein
LAVDTERREILLIEKRLALSCRVFRLPLSAGEGTSVAVAEQIARLRLAIVTAMDVAPDGSRAIVATLGQAYQFGRLPAEDWSAAFTRPPNVVSLPPRRQGEAICYGPDGANLFLTSEQRPTPLFRVPALPPASE